MAAEWEELTKRKPFLFFNHSDFISEKYHSLDNVSCSLSWNCESAIVSAYIRTIGYCLAQGILDRADLVEYVVPALPFGQPLSDIDPNHRPDFWPDFGDLTSSDDEPNEAVLQRFLNEWKLSNEVPLFASGPLQSDEHGIDMDWDCLVVSEEDHQRQPSDIFEHKTRTGASELVERVIPRGIGRWQAELCMRGYVEPSFNINGSSHIVQPFANKVVFMFDREPIAYWKFWLEEWFPARLRGCGSNFAVATCCSTGALEKISNAVGSDLYLVVRLRVVGEKFTSSKVQQGDYFATKKIYERHSTRK